MEHQRADQHPGCHSRYHADSDRSGRNAGQHVQRSGRLHPVEVEEPGGGLEVGQVPRFDGLPGPGRHRRRRRPGKQGQGAGAFKAKNIDVTPFTAQVDDKTTFLFPITDHRAAVQQIMKAAMDNVLKSSADPSSLTDANDQVNALFQ